MHSNAVKADSLAHPILQLLLCITVLLALASCTGGSNGDSIGISADQTGTDPVAVAVPIAFIKRPLPVDTQDVPDLRDPNAFHSGAELYVRQQSSSTNEIAVHDQIIAIAAAEEGVDIDQIELDIKDLESSYDGTTLIFAARAVPAPVNTNLELTTWNIWLYDIENKQARYLINDRLLRNEGFDSGGGQDTAPYFLNDEEIIFSSTRQINSQAKQLNEGRSQLYSALTESRTNPASVLHRFSPDDGSNTIKQLSFNPNHDIDPVILDNGQILFSRFNSATNHYSFYTVNPDGLQMSMLYGHRSSDTGSPGTTVNFTQARELPDGRIVSILKTFAAPSLGGNLVIIDKDNYVEINQPIWNSTSSSNSQGQINAINIEVRTDTIRSEGGQFAAVYPLNDDTQRLLVSWSPCRVVNDLSRPIPCNLDPNETYTTLAPPLYGIWMLDATNNTQQPVVLAQEGFYISEIVAAQQRNFPSLAPLIDGTNSDIISAEQGQLIIDSVYDIDGTDSSPSGISNHAEPGTTAFSSRPARFIRLIKAVPLPNDDVIDIPNYAFGVGGNTMREILGYSIIEPDGSVNTTVPANTAFTIDIVDANARRISNRHNHWLQLAPGEKLHCVGCHDRNSDQAHGRVDSKPSSANRGAQPRNDGSMGFFATLAELHAFEGDTMATIYDLRRPVNNEDITERQLSLHPVYQDEWTDPVINTTDNPIDLTYDNQWVTDPNWTNVAAPIVVPNLDPNLDSRIVINYVDHIQTIWSRIRTAVNDANGNPIDSCVGCHNTNNDTAVPPGQLDLTNLPSDINPDHFRSYRELLTNDNEQWIDDAGRLSDRERLCNSLDANGDPVVDANNNPVIVTENLTIRRNLAANSAAASSAFFNCFNGGSCGTSNSPKAALRPECIEGEGTPEPPTANTVDHNGLLSEAELRLISEWLDIGAQYYNNPFDFRLAP